MSSLSVLLTCLVGLLSFLCSVHGVDIPSEIQSLSSDKKCTDNPEKTSFCQFIARQQVKGRNNCWRIYPGDGQGLVECPETCGTCYGEVTVPHALVHSDQKIPLANITSNTVPEIPSISPTKLVPSFIPTVAPSSLPTRNNTACVYELRQGDTLRFGDFLCSENGSYLFGFDTTTPSENLVLSTKTNWKLWFIHPNTKYNPDELFATFNEIGDFVVGDERGVRWGTHSYHKGGEVMTLLDTGHIQMVDAEGSIIWKTISPSCTDPLVPETHLYPGQYICSPNRKYKFGLTHEGDLTLWSEGLGKIWSTGNRMSYEGESYLEFLHDTNVILYENTEEVWSIRHGQNATKLVVRDNGAASLLTDDGSTLWTTGAYGCFNRLESGGKLYQDQYICSLNGDYQFGLDSLGDLSLWSVFDGKVKIWSANTTKANVATIQKSDGNFVVYKSGKSQWSSDTNDKRTNAESYVEVFNDGSVRIKNATDYVSWSIEVSDHQVHQFNTANMFSEGSTQLDLYGGQNKLGDEQNMVIANLSSTTLEYIPGQLETYENGILLSAGLQSKIIATSGERVLYKDGSVSSDFFHLRPDGGATFDDPNGDGWIYVSNSEVKDGGGGVGALTFDANGHVIDYRKILNGTSMNCSGGKTPWGSWLSCEETDGGQIFETDPTGTNPSNITALGEKGGYFEAVAYDCRNMKKPHFFYTEDQKDGAIRRFTPDKNAVKEALANSSFSKVLTSPGEIEYLVLKPLSEGNGNFKWSSSHNRGRETAEEFFPNTEGIDVKDGFLYFTSKVSHLLYILDLDNHTYTATSTNVGAFYGQPDQITRVVNGTGILYFCEDMGTANAGGVHARDTNGLFFTILKGVDYVTETTGLAFSPNNKFLYVSFQDSPGLIFAISRKDGLSFNGAMLDIKYHTVWS